MYMPGTVLNGLHALTQLILKTKLQDTYDFNLTFTGHEI